MYATFFGNQTKCGRNYPNYRYEVYWLEIIRSVK